MGLRRKGFWSKLEPLLIVIKSRLWENRGKLSIIIKYKNVKVGLVVSIYF